METNTANNVATAPQNGTAAAPANEPQTLADVIGGSEAPVAQQPTEPVQQPQQPLQEPGWFQGRMQKERAKWESEHQVQLNQMQERQNALMERVIAREAQDLVSSGEFKTLERATEYLRLKEGIPVQAEQPSAAQLRDSSGRFVSPQSAPNAEIQQRAQELVNQADLLQKGTGIDVMAIYNTNPEARQLILNGGDFADVLKAYGSPQAQPVQAPTLTRAANGVSVGQTSIKGMTNDQFSAMQKYLAGGGKIDMRR